ncbi:MAG: acetyltransferase, partial [Firmicutes bacterium]|nr:acetyltransferase [Bacillota bacterium]
VVGCATICYIKVLPTFSHPSGNRAHIMNVYTRSNYRRQGIALHMMEMLIEEARAKGVTEISLDATDAGRLLYEKCGFIRSEEGMVHTL